MTTPPQSDRQGYCSVFFPRTGPLRLDDMGYLECHGLRISPGSFEGAAWALELGHRQWGRATLFCMPELPLPSREVLRFTSGLCEEERDSIASARSGLQILVPPQTKNVLRDRKRMLRFAQAVMGSDGLAVADHASKLFWTARALEDELCHDADLDITGLFVTHAVYSESDTRQNGDEHPPTRWMHTHGLAELGALDFDILRPNAELHGGAYDAVRALAFAIVEGEVWPGAPPYQLGNPRGGVALVRADVFQVRAAPADAALRDHDEAHSSDRVVVCDPPAGGPLALLRGRPRPSRFLSRGINDRSVIHFTKGATELMAERARNTYGVFRTLFGDLQHFELPALVKLGYETDLRGGNVEHLWFQVHGVRDSIIDATLINRPYAIAGMHEGQRAEHPAERLTDWSFMTPLGSITPRDFRAARAIRENPGRMAQFLATLRMMGVE
ncbi:MAG TPA: DUF4026 domain-containing protein [Phycisphaerales bacterium]|nr:DUF4026 domain-containing protein [Phycisphaerales bacterium]